MRATVPLSSLLLAALLAGCSLGGDESSGGVDRSAYEGGGGVALAITNEGSDPFVVDLRVLGVGNVEHASINETLRAGESVERWYSLEAGTYSARLSYMWSAVAGRAAHGFDDETFTVADCPEVSRFAWTLVQHAEGPGSRFEGKTCVPGDDA